MIRTLEDLKKLGEREAASLQSAGLSHIAVRTNLSSPAVTFSEVEKIKEALPGISLEYCSVVGKIPVLEKCIGSLQLWPDGFGYSLAESLIACNSDRNGYYDAMVRDGVYGVAFYEGEPISIAKSPDGKDSRVFTHQLGSPELPLIEVAPSFETFLILFGNLRELGQYCDDSEEAKFAAFSGLLNELVTAPESRKRWEYYAGCELG